MCGSDINVTNTPLFGISKMFWPRFISQGGILLDYFDLHMSL